MTNKPLTHWKKYYNPDYLGAYSLEPGQDLIATIGKVIREMVEGEGGRKEECTVVYFKEQKIKKMILNRTNCKTISRIYETPYIEEWEGKKIQIFKSETKVKGEEVECLRIRPFTPQTTLPELTPSHEKWSGAVQTIREGRNTLEGIQEHVRLSPTNLQKLIEESNAQT